MSRMRGFSLLAALLLCAGLVLAGTGALEGGRVLLPASAPWVKDFVSEVLAFPVGQHDDQVDVLAYAVHAARESQRYDGPRVWCSPPPKPIFPVPGEPQRPKSYGWFQDEMDEEPRRNGRWGRWWRYEE